MRFAATLIAATMDPFEFCRTLTKRADTTEARQALFRAEMTPAGYRGGVHLGFTVVVTAAVAALAWTGVEHWSWSAAAGLGIGLLASMAVIYFGHRYPMHRRLRGATAAYDLHTRVHHMLFDRDHLEVANLRDLGMVMLPKGMTLAMTVIGFPLLAAPLALWSADAALAFLGLVVLYYLAYELVHLAAHAPDDSIVHRLPGLGFLTAHHRHHHDHTVMHRANFGMVVPVLDYVFGTRQRPPSRPR